MVTTSTVSCPPGPVVMAPVRVRFWASNTTWPDVQSSVRTVTLSLAAPITIGLPAASSTDAFGTVDVQDQRVSTPVNSLGDAVAHTCVWAGAYVPASPAISVAVAEEKGASGAPQGCTSIRTTPLPESR